MLRCKGRALCETRNIVRSRLPRRENMDLRNRKGFLLYYEVFYAMIPAFLPVFLLLFYAILIQDYQLKVLEIKSNINILTHT